MSIGIKYSYEVNAFAKAFAAKYDVAARAATGAMGEVAAKAKLAGRASIRSGGPGFQRRWPNALRATVYPGRGKVSASPAAVIKISSDYAGIFEEGGTITGSPYLWIPLKDTPKTVNGKRMRPGLLRNLITIRRPGKPPLLGVRVKGTAARFGKKLTLSQIQRGTSAKRGVIRVIPLFVGVPKTVMPKKWDIARACAEASRELPALYFKNLKDI